jgi:hypothetical protein
MDSAIDASGSFPISSAETDSTISSDRFFVFTAFWRAARNPVTTIAPLSASVSSVWAAAVSVVEAVVAAGSVVGSVWACAGVAKLNAIASGLAAAAKRQRKEVLFINVVPLMRSLAAATNSC